MSRDCTRTTIEVSCDERLLPGIGGAVAHHADRMGLTEAARDSLVSALEDFCRETLPLLGLQGGRLAVAIEEFDDRIQIIVEHHGLAEPSVGMETFLAAGAAKSKTSLPGVRLLRIVDSVEYDSRNGGVRTTLVKFLKPRRSES